MLHLVKFTADQARTHASWAASLGIVHILPRRVLNNITAFNLGRLSTSDRLRMREVPAITLEDITKAMQDEAR